jgi:hypothetical protein
MCILGIFAEQIGSQDPLPENISELKLKAHSSRPPETATVIPSPLMTGKVVAAIRRGLELL